MFATIGASWALLGRGHKLILLGLTMLRILSNLLDVLGLLFLSLVVSRLFDESMSFAMVGALLEWVPSSTFSLALMTLGLFVAKSISGALISRKTVNFLSQIEIEQSARIAHSIFGGGLERLEMESKSDIEWLVNRSPSYAFVQVLSNFLQILAEVSLAFMVLTVMAVSDWKATVGVFLYFGIAALIFQKITGPAINSAGSTQIRATVGANRAVSEGITIFREAYVLGKLDFVIEDIVKNRSLMSISDATVQFVSTLPRLFLELVLVVGMFGIVASVFSASAGDAEFATLGVLTVGSLRIISVLLPLQRSIVSLAHISPLSVASQERIREINAMTALNIDQPVTASAPEATHSQLPASGISIEFNRVYFSHRPRKGEPSAESDVSSTIDNLSFTIPDGSFAAIVGDSGAGKSTLADLMLGIRSPSQGEVRIAGCDPAKFIASKPGAVGFVPQKPGYVAGSILQNIALGVSSNEIDEEAVANALKLANLWDFVSQLPDGVESNLGQHLSAFSGGQVQRIGLARALYTQPKLLVLDEATSALDPENEERIASALKSLTPEMTVVAIAHRPATLEKADIVLVMSSGKLVASGPLSEVRTKSAKGAPVSRLLFPK